MLERQRSKVLLGLFGYNPANLIKGENQKMKKGTLLTLLVLAVISVAFGQGSSTRPKPGPEHSKLGALVGNWATEGQLTENPFGPAEIFSGKITSEWFDGRFAVVRHAQSKGSVSGEGRSLDVITYDSATRNYTWYGIDNAGTTSGLIKGSIAGDTLTMVWEMPAKGKIYKMRGTLKGLGSDKLTYVQEYSEDGKAWKAFMHSTDTRSRS